MKLSMPPSFRPHLVVTLLVGLLCGVAALVPTLGQADPSEKSPKQVNEGPDGAKLWAQTCSQCHNLRPPDTFSGAQWEVIVHHMRVRARLTVAESRAIADFLKGGK